MSVSSRSTSPDPLTFSNSRLPVQSSNAPRQTSVNPLAPRSSNVVKSSPSKSFVMDTGAAGDASPWRIKVTVEAEPQDGNSPAKKMVRTTKIPLKGGSSSSPVKSARPRRTNATDATDESEMEIKRPQRKRKGTPIRRSTRNTQPVMDESEPAHNKSGIGISVSRQLQEELSSPSKRPIPSRTRRSSGQAPTERSKRLSHAREELDVALRNALDDDDDDDGAEVAYDYVPGDMTVANEDFTMVSVDTLQSMKQNTSQLLDNSGIDRSVASVSYMPSSPPQPLLRRSPKEVQYPDISNLSEKSKSRTSQDVSAYDAMSWKPNGPAEVAAFSKKTISPQYPAIRPIQSQGQHEAVSQEIENAHLDQLVAIEEDVTAGAERHSGGEREDDIWAEEASRSLEEDQVQPQAASVIQPAHTAAAINDLFSDQPMKPLRGKIPRTWRRSSGMDFSYVDSPEYGALKSIRKVSGTDTDGSGGVLTPPESSDEDDQAKVQDSDGVEPRDEDVDADLTHPDAAATELRTQEPHHYRPTPASNIGSNEKTKVRRPQPESGRDVVGSDNEQDDTGVFWQTHQPSVYNRRQRSRLLPKRKERAVDLSELLRQGNNESMAESSRAPRDTHRVVENSMTAEESSSKQAKSIDRAAEEIAGSPLRHSLLKSSKLDASVPPSSKHEKKVSSMRYTSRVEAEYEGHSLGARLIELSKADESYMDSFESKASDQRQLLAEMESASTSRKAGSALRGSETGHEMWSEAGHEVDEDGQSYVSGTENQELDQDEDEDEDVSEGVEDNESEEFEETDHRMQSYEEHLNLESPQKIKVKFNDSEGNSSLIAPKKEYPPLFGGLRGTLSNQKLPATSSTPVGLAKGTAPAPDTQPGIFSRLSTTFWSTVVRPSGPVSVSPEPEPEYSPSLRARIRSRYGVLSDQHPWTMAHMRTLHRLLNSCTSGKADSIVPKNGPLPSALRRLIGQELQCVTEFRWKFTEQHAHVVDAFMQVLVPSHYIEAMQRGEVDFIGDSEAKRHRGNFGGRHGDDLVFNNIPGVKLPQGAITRDFVVKALGNAVSANVETAKRQTKEAERTRRAVAAKPSLREENWSEDVSAADESEILHKVVRIK